MAKNVEDELFELLNSPDPVLTVKPGTSSAPAASFAITSPSYEDSQDFLSWLDETPVKKDPAIQLDHNASFGPSELSDFLDSVSGPNQSSAVQPTVLFPADERKGGSDPLYDEVFGNDSPRKSAEKGVDVNESEKLEEFETLIHSPFPDIGLLRELVDKHGYIPEQYRLQTLLLLLTGSSQADDEAQRYQVAEVEREFYRELVSDTEHLLSACGSTLKVESTTVAANMIDIIVLYCQRRSIDYRNIFSRVMLSIFGRNPSASKALASSCFYALLSNFYPLVGLQYTALELSVDAVHSWLRLLVLYHSPSLAQHLDRVLPGWEKPAREMTATQSSKFTALHKVSNALDSFERELGIDLDLDDDFTSGGTSTGGLDGRLVESAAPKSAASRGMLPSHLITTCFAGSLPAEQSAALLDWAVFNGERFAGVYFMASLLELYAPALEQMNAAQLSQWFDDLAANRSDWFRSLSSSPQMPKPMPESWDEFAEAWIHATAALLANTPQAFREALQRTETWATATADRQRRELSSQLQTLRDTDEHDLLDDALFESSLDDARHGANADGSAPTTTGAVASDGEHEGEGGDDESTDRASEDSSNRGDKDGLFVRRASNLMDNLRTWTAKLGTTGGDEKVQGRGIADHDDTESDFPQDRKLNAETLCLWTEASEVVPSLCGSQKNHRQVDSRRSVRDVFTDRLQVIQSQGSPSYRRICFFAQAPDQDQGPVYFAIDCRSAEEKSLGMFPKAFAVSPEEVVDSDGLTHLLMVLEPLRNSTHITIIGAGEAYHRWQVLHTATKALRVPTANKKKQQQRLEESIRQKIRDERDRLNAVAVFLIKRAFRFVSVLDGGFYSAAQVLTRSESRYTLSSALVDCDRARLHALLGIPDASGPSTSVGLDTFKTVGDTVLTQAPQAIKSVGTLLSTWVSGSVSSGDSTHGKGTKGTQGSADSNSGAATPVPAPTQATTTATVPESNAPAEATGSQPAATGFRLSAWGSALGKGLDSLKKGIAVAATAAAATSIAGLPPAAGAGDDRRPGPITTASSSLRKTADTSFIIGEDDDDDESSPRNRAYDIADSHSIGVSRTDQERAQALALHRMAGLKKGDHVTISRAELPGAILFPATKQKVVLVTAKKPAAATTTDLLDLPSSESTDPPATEEEEKVEQAIPVARYLVVSRERFMVLDAQGGGVGAVALVKSNHHLTELVKMTFKKKDPELITLHLLSHDGESKPRQYRVAKYQEFISTLQKNMERFKT